jgi:hypothetical protein
MAATRATVSQDVRKKLTPENIKLFRKGVKEMDKCGDKLNLLARMFTSLPALQQTGTNVKVWFRNMRFAFHPDKFVTATPGVQSFVSDTSKLLNSCIESQLRWLVTYRVQKPKLATFELKPGEEKAFDKERAKYFLWLVTRAAEEDRARARRARADQDALRKARAKEQSTLDKWLRQFRKKKKELDENFQVVKGHYEPKTVAVKKVSRVSGKRRVTMEPKAPRSRAAALLPTVSDYRMYIRYILFHLPRLSKFTGVRAIISEHIDEMAALAEEFGYELPPDRKEIELQAVQLANEFVEQQAGRKRNAFIADEAEVDVPRSKSSKKKKRMQSVKDQSSVSKLLRLS